MKLNSKHRILLGALRRIKRPVSCGALVTGATGTIQGSTAQFEAALNELRVNNDVEVYDGWVLPVKEE